VKKTDEPLDTSRMQTISADGAKSNEIKTVSNVAS